MVESLYRHLIQKADIGQSRTSSLNPLQWVLAIFFGGTIGLILVHAPTWLIIAAAILLVLVTLLLGAAYIYFMRRDPDALRSENYSLSKMALEKGLVGDDIFGLRVPEERPIAGSRLAALPEPSQEKPKGQ